MTSFITTRLAAPLRNAAPTWPLPIASPRSLLGLLRLWRTRSQQRSVLFRAPQSVLRELQSRGMDVEHEVAKRFWQP